MGDVMLDHRTNNLLLAEIGALQRDDVVENRLAALKEKYEDGRRRQVGKSDKLQHFYLGPTRRLPRRVAFPDEAVILNATFVIMFIHRVRFIVVHQFPLAFVCLLEEKSKTLLHF